MPEELTNTEYRTTTRPRDADASGVQDWKPGLKPSPMRGYSLSVGPRRTRAMLPARISHKLNTPTWHKLYGEALLETDPEILLKLLAAAERAVFDRVPELAANEAGSDERQDIRRAIDVMLTLKTQARSKTSSVELPGVGLTGMRDRVTVLGGSFEILSSGKGTSVKVAIPLAQPPRDPR